MTKTILILAANPKDTQRLRLDQEVREIDNGLQRAQRRDEFVLKQVWAARPVDVRRAMLDSRPNIVHFCGHGAGKEGIAFEDETGHTTLVNAEALAGLFELFANQVGCIILNACYSETQAQAIARHIDYVVGMKKDIGDTAAIEFAVAFYDALGAGESIEFAYKLACNAIQWANVPEHLTPVLKTKARSTQERRPQLQEKERVSDELETSVEQIESSQRSMLRRVLSERLDSEELRTLCFDLGINFDGLRGEGQVAKARELIAYCEKRGQIESLISELRKARPDIDTTPILISLRRSPEQVAQTETLHGDENHLASVRKVAVRSQPDENMVQIPRGSFLMGSNNGEQDERPVHQVYVDDFYMDKYEVTVAEFRKFIDATSYVTEAEKEGYSYQWTEQRQRWGKMPGINWRYNAKGNQIKAGSEGSNHPVVHVSWKDAVAYAEWAGKRLPTEAEWERAARGWNTGIGGFPTYEYPWGDNFDTKLVNYENLMTSSVGKFPPNGFGLYDMVGNVWEWVGDWYDAGYYASSPTQNPKGPDSGRRRVMRGGSWLVISDLRRCALRSRLHFVPWSNDTGFRCVLDI